MEIVQQWVKHTWLYSDLLQALKGEHWSALGSQQRLQYSTAGDAEKTTAKKEKEDMVEPLFQDQLVLKMKQKMALKEG